LLRSINRAIISERIEFASGMDSGCLHETEKLKRPIMGRSIL
jgi:hypothetical protein